MAYCFTIADVVPQQLLWLAVALVVLIFCSAVLGIRYIPNNRVGIIEKLWSSKGSVVEGRMLALRGEAGYQADLLRGGIHMFLWPWQYRIHKVSLVTVPQGKIGYVYARDGEPLPPSQTLGRIVDCNNFQDARAFFGSKASEKGGGVGGAGAGQRGRQRAILREGVYAINCRPVRRRHRRRGLPLGNAGTRGIGDDRRLAERARRHRRV